MSTVIELPRRQGSPSRTASAVTPTLARARSFPGEILAIATAFPEGTSVLKVPFLSVDAYNTGINFS
jgi:hypothetical protein